jgi:hypothetical protein
MTASKGRKAVCVAEFMTGVHEYNCESPEVLELRI